MKHWPREEAGISLNSLLDVLFILLLFLMISLNLRPENYLDVQLPDVDATELEAGSEPALLVELSAEKELYLKHEGGSERFSLHDLALRRSQLRQLCAENGQVLLRVDRAVLYEDLIQVLEVLQSCEGADLAIQKAD